MRIYSDPKDDPRSQAIHSENPNAFSDKLTNPTEKEKLADMSVTQKIDYIWSYYKIPIIIVLIVILIAVYSVYGFLHKKEQLLTVTITNTSTEQEQDAALSDPFITEFLQLDPDKYEIVMDSNMFLDDPDNPTNAELAYATQMKLVAYVAAGQMDIVFMNDFSYNAFSQRGYLEDLNEYLGSHDPELYEALKDQITTNSMIVNDNSNDVVLDSSVEYTAEMEEHPFAFKYVNTELFPYTSEENPLYVGIVVNSKNTDAAVQYLRFLYGLDSDGWVPESSQK